MICKISVWLEEPLKMKTKIKFDSNNQTADIPFENLTVYAKPFCPEGNYFEIKLDSPKSEPGQKPKGNQNGLIQNLWHKICRSGSKQKPSPPQSHIIMAEEKVCESNNLVQGGDVYEENKGHQAKNSETVN